jgi:two-component system response regulator RegA
MSSTAATMSVLIVDDHEPFSTGLARSFRALGATVWVATDYSAAGVIAETSKLELIVTELRVGRQWSFEQIGRFKQTGAGRVVIATVYPSVATAVRSVRLGFDAYVAKPTSARNILESIDLAEDGRIDDQTAASAWPSLDRTIWEYLNEVFMEAGTMSEAARRLGLDRRSLRRMLAKYPPAR